MVLKCGRLKSFFSMIVFVNLVLTHVSCIYIIHPSISYLISSPLSSQANTNAMVAMVNAPSIPAKNFTALTRLDQNRAVAQLSLRTKLPIDAVKVPHIYAHCLLIFCVCVTLNYSTIDS